MIIELERTFFLKYFPFSLTSKAFEECTDIYLPTKSRHPHLRIRKLGKKYEITKKHPIKKDSSEQSENTIVLSKEEFDELGKIKGLRIHKFRYRFSVKNVKAELDVFQDNLFGLILIDFEFESVSQKNNFVPPDFCLTEVTQQEIIAGGYLAGKNFKDILPQLKRFGYEDFIKTQN